MRKSGELPSVAHPRGPVLDPLEATRNVIGTISSRRIQPDPHAFVSLGGAPRDFWLAVCRQLLALQRALRASLADAFQHKEQREGLVSAASVSDEALSTWKLETLRSFADALLTALAKSRVLKFDVDPRQFAAVPIARLVDLWASLLIARAPAPEVPGAPDHSVARQRDQERAAMVAEGIRDLLVRSRGIGLGRFRAQLDSVSSRLARIAEQETNAPASDLEKASQRTWAAIQQQAQRLRRIAQSLGAAAE